ncbi:MAG: F-type H+-transporting ATPase subunit epsilon [Myxococcota bacterium]|jgi:F-type H+-transporting ATPase subunit epsilon
MPVALKIVTPTSIALEGEANEVQIPGFVGEYGVLPDHAQMLTLTKPGVVTVHGGDHAGQLLVGKGLAEVGPGSITLLVDLCEDVSKIDKAAAKRELERAQADLKTVAAGGPEAAAINGRIMLAQARIDA